MNRKEEIKDIVQGLDSDRQAKPSRPAPPTPGTRALNNRIDKAVADLKADYAAYYENPKKDAVYGLLTAVFRVGRHFAGKEQGQYLIDRISAHRGPKARKGEGVFAFLLRATTTANRKTRHKWAQALEIAYRNTLVPFELERDITGAGGLNNYISRWSHLLDRSHEQLEPKKQVDGWDDEPRQDPAPDTGWSRFDDEVDELLPTYTPLVIQKAPAPVRNALQEAQRCLQRQVPTAATMMCWLALQRACAARGAKGPLQSACQRLASETAISPLLQEQSCRVLPLIMRSVSEGNTASFGEAKEVFKFTLSVTDALFP